MPFIFLHFESARSESDISLVDKGSNVLELLMISKGALFQNN